MLPRNGPNLPCDPGFLLKLRRHLLPTGGVSFLLPPALFRREKLLSPVLGGPGSVEEGLGGWRLWQEGLFRRHFPPRLAGSGLPNALNSLAHILSWLGPRRRTAGGQQAVVARESFQRGACWSLAVGLQLNTAGKVQVEERGACGRPPRLERAGRLWEGSGRCVEAPVSVCFREFCPKDSEEEVAGGAQNQGPRRPC